MTTKEIELNAKDEKIELKLTEWEFDAVCQLVMGVQFPATHVDVANNLIQKIKKIHIDMVENKNGNS